MPFKSDAQRKFLFANEPKVAKEFAEATPKGADLPEHVKKMADGGAVDAMPDLETSAESFDKGMTHENVTHDSDAVKSYLASKFRSLLHPGQEQVPVADTDTVKVPTGMADGGYPHVTFMENMPQEQVEKVVHLGNPPTPEPAKAEVSQQEKTDTIYRAMGMGKYAVGGIVPPAPVGPQVGLPGMPNQADPNFWEQVKAALSKVSAPVTSAANAAVAPLEAGAKMATPLVPPAVSAINRLTGADLPVPAAPAAPAPDLGAPTPLSAPVAPTPAPMPPVAAPKAAPGAGEPSELKNLFNQDTSKLTEGVEGADRQKVADTMTGRQTGVGSILAEALAGLGDAISAKGGRDTHALKDIFTMQKQQRDEALANFDKNRQSRLEKLDLQTKMGNNTIQKLAAQDAYGVDEHLNKMLGAPAGTAHKDLPLYMQMATAKIAQDEKDSDLYLKAHSQAANEVEASIKNAGIFNVKPSPEQIKAAGAKLADNYYNRAKGNVLFQPSDGQKPIWIPAKNMEAAKKMDPNGQIIQ